MIEINTQGEALDLPSGFSIEIEDSSPIFNDRGSQSIPATVPTTRRNIRLLDAPHRIDTGVNPNIPERKAEIREGGYMRRGTMNITEAGRNEGITFNIGFDNSTAYAIWSKKKLSELSNLPTYQPQLHDQGYHLDDILDDLYRIYRYGNPDTDDFAIFPVAVNNESTGTDANKKTYWEVLNLAGSHGFSQPSSVKRLLDGEITDVTVPEGYMVTPFLRVWRIIDLIFKDLGLSIYHNPFRADPELARLVVLNNAADAVCTGKVKYSDLMPDSTVEEFLNALWVRFGLVYNIDNNTATVSLLLLKDIIAQRGNRQLEDFATGYEVIRYEEPQYIKLSANTSIEGAAPSHERFEDFIKGLDVSKVHLGTNVTQWQNTGSQDDPRWDGDWMDGYWDDYDPWEDPDWEDPEPPEPDWPDPDDRDDDRDDGRDDDRDYDYYAARSAAPETRADTSVTSKNNTFLAREFVTGKWYRLDSTNGKVRLSSSSFFNWDPQPEGLTALDLSSDDECVPVERVSTVGLGVGHTFNDKCPLYLFGARHYHSYIKGSDETESSGDKTPLAFMFAYTTGNKTIGRINPEGEDGKVITLDDGTKPTISLLFQFKDGLFAKFWADYDEILRHGNRSVEVNARINKLELPRMDLLQAYTFRGIRVLIDTMTYSLPSGREVSADLKLRTIQTQGKYNIKEEQNIPDFAAAARHLEWFLYSESYGEKLNTAKVRSMAAQKYIADHNYKPHGTTGDYWYIGAEGIVFKSISRLYPTWETDTTKPTPNNQGQQNMRTYKARITYDVFEWHDLSQGPDEDDREPDEIPIGEVSIDVDYTVVLYSKWVTD